MYEVIKNAEQFIADDEQLIRVIKQLKNVGGCMMLDDAIDWLQRDIEQWEGLIKNNLEMLKIHSRKEDNRQV